MLYEGVRFAYALTSPVELHLVYCCCSMLKLIDKLVKSCLFLLLLVHLVLSDAKTLAVADWTQEDDESVKDNWNIEILKWTVRELKK